MLEEFTHLRKSKPVILGAGVIWIIAAILASGHPHGDEWLHTALNHNLIEYSGDCLSALNNYQSEG